MNIYGEYFNPITISGFEIVKGKRIGRHPLRFRLLKKLPWYRRIFVQTEKDSILDDWWVKAGVNVKVCGKTDLFIGCNSNSRAREIYDDLVEMHQEALRSLINS